MFPPTILTTSLLLALILAQTSLALPLPHPITNDINTRTLQSADTRRGELDPHGADKRQGELDPHGGDRRRGWIDSRESDGDGNPMGGDTRRGELDSRGPDGLGNPLGGLTLVETDGVNSTPRRA